MLRNYGIIDVKTLQQFTLGKHYIRLQLLFKKKIRSRLSSSAGLWQNPRLPQLWLHHSVVGCCSQLNTFPCFIPQPTSPKPPTCQLGDGFGFAFLLLYTNRHSTLATAAVEISRHYTHMIRLIITPVGGRRRRKRIEINDLL